MKVIYAELNKEWHKICPKCDNTYTSASLEGIRIFFPKDSSKYDGFDVICKKCKLEYRKNNKARELARWKSHHLPGTDNIKKHIIRSQTRRKHGSAKLQKCNNCGEQASEWHHIEYKVDGAIPLCSNCHEDIS